MPVARAINLRLTEAIDAERLRPDLGRATRSTVALLLALSLAVFGDTGLETAFLAVSAHTLANVDIRGPYWQRVASLAAIALVMALTAGLGAAAGSSAWLTVLATMLLAANAAIWRHLAPEYGPGVAVPTGLVFFMALFAPRGEPALGSIVWHHALSVWTGAGIGVLVHVALWPIRAQHPLRRGVADAWTAAAGLFDALRNVRPDAAVRNRTTIEPLANAESVLRDALDAAAGTLARSGVGAGRRRRELIARLELLRTNVGRLAARGASLATALEASAIALPARGQCVAEPQDGSATTTASTSMSGSNTPGEAGASVGNISCLASETRPAFVMARAEPEATRAAAVTALEALAMAARAAALATLSQQPAHLTAADVRLRRAHGLLESMRDADPQVADIALAVAASTRDVRQALAAVTPRAGERSVVPMTIGDRETARPTGFASALNLSRHVEPTLVRFALRLSALLVIGVALSHLLVRASGGSWSHAYWLPLTMIVLAQPDYGATRQRVAQRLGGTLVGSVVASGVMMLHPPVAVLLPAIGACGFVFSFFLRRRHALAVAFLTVMVVLLLEAARPVSIGVTIERLVATALGGAMTLAAAAFFWPHWERDRYATVLAEALRANRGFVHAVARRLAAGGAYGADDVAAKRGAEQANAAALASLGRLYADPTNRRGDVEQAAALLEGNRRLTRLFNLILLQSLRTTRDDPIALSGFADRAGRRLEAIATCFAAQTGCPGERAPLPASTTAPRGLTVAIARAEAELNAMESALTRRENGTH